MATRTESVEARLARIEAENDSLRADLASSSEVGKPRRSSGRMFAAIVLILIGALLSPTALIIAWAKAELTNTDRFVAMLAPLAQKPEIQGLLVDKITTVIDDKVDIEGTTSDLFEGLAKLDLPPRALAALTLLEAPAVAGVNSLIERTATRVVESDAFASVWEQALRVSHTQIIAALEGNQADALVISDSGEVGIAIGPIVDVVAGQLTESGLALGAKIPEVNLVIPLGQFDAIVQARAAYAGLNLLSWLIPLLSLLLIAGGILVAPTTWRAGMHAAIAVAIMMLTLAGGIAIGRTVFIISVAPFLSSGPAFAFYDAVVPLLGNLAITIAVLALVAAVWIYLASPAPRAVRFRAAMVAMAHSVKRSIDERRDKVATDVKSEMEQPADPPAVAAQASKSTEAPRTTAPKAAPAKRAAKPAVEPPATSRAASTVKPTSKATTKS